MEKLSNVVRIEDHEVVVNRLYLATLVDDVQYRLSALGDEDVGDYEGELHEALFHAQEALDD